MVGLKITAKISRKGDGAKRLAAIRKALAGPKLVKVGFPSGKVAGDVITYAFFNHEGTHRAKGDVFFRNGKFGISGPTPARPFITQAMFKGRNSIRAMLRVEAKAIFSGKNPQPVRFALQRIGLKGVDLIQAQIASNMGPPNKPMTIYLKGSSKTLIDSGRMMQSVTWAIDE